jgi:GPH family glycoside/pentoside/hexuronide:cation symporter
MDKKTGAVLTGSMALAVAVVPYVLRLAGLFPLNGSTMLIPMLFTLVTISNSLAVCSMMLAQSMAADVVEASQAETGERNEGLFFSGYFFVQKCSHGIGIFLSGTIVSLSGFPAQAKPGQVSPDILNNFIIYFLIMLVMLGIASILPMTRFPITRRDHEARLVALAAANEKRD